MAHSSFRIIAVAALSYGAMLLTPLGCDKGVESDCTSYTSEEWVYDYHYYLTLGPAWCARSTTPFAEARHWAEDRLTYYERARPCASFDHEDAFDSCAAYRCVKFLRTNVMEARGHSSTEEECASTNWEPDECLELSVYFDSCGEVQPD